MGQPWEGVGVLVVWAKSMAGLLESYNGFMACTGEARESVGEFCRSLGFHFGLCQSGPQHHLEHHLLATPWAGLHNR